MLSGDTSRSRTLSEPLRDTTSSSRTSESAVISPSVSASATGANELSGDWSWK